MLHIIHHCILAHVINFLLFDVLLSDLVLRNRSFGRDFLDLLLSPASKVLNNWFEVIIIYDEITPNGSSAIEDVTVKSDIYCFPACRQRC